MKGQRLRREKRDQSVHETARETRIQIKTGEQWGTRAEARSVRKKGGSGRVLRGQKKVFFTNTKTERKQK